MNNFTYKQVEVLNRVVHPYRKRGRHNKTYHIGNRRSGRHKQKHIV